MKKDDYYEKTSEQLDNMTTTVITGLLTAFIVSQQFIGTSNIWTKIAAVFSLLTLFLHYLSFIAAHKAQINNPALKNNKKLKNFYSRWTGRINNTVYIFVALMFIMSTLIIFST